MMNTGFGKPQFNEVAAREGLKAVFYDEEFSGLVEDFPPRSATSPGSTPRHRQASAWSRTCHPRQHLRSAAARGIRRLRHPHQRHDRTAKGRASLQDLTVRRCPGPRPHPAVAAQGGRHRLADLPLHRLGALGHPDRAGQHRRPHAPVQPGEDPRRDRGQQDRGPRRRTDHALPHPRPGRRRHQELRHVLAEDGGRRRLAPPPALCEWWQDTFGDTLYNLYGSTEVAVVSVATPQDLRQSPGTIGKAPVSSYLRLYDDNDKRITATNTRAACSSATVHPSRAAPTAGPSRSSTATCPRATWRSSTTTACGTSPVATTT